MGFSRQYLELTAPSGLLARESHFSPSPAPARYTREKVVSLLWMKQPWAPYPLRDVTGKRVWIISPGWMRGGGGPDFSEAAFRVEDGNVIKGDVEIHFHSDDWKIHRHHTDPAYDQVRLHVVMHGSQDPAAQTTSSGRSLMEIEISSAYPSWKEDIRLAEDSPGEREESVDTAPGACFPILSRMAPGHVINLLNSAGEGRLIMKSRRISSLTARVSGEEALYHGLMEALGYAPFRKEYLRLAESLPLALLRKIIAGIDHFQRGPALQAVFFGMAGLAPVIVEGWDEETRDWAGGTAATWRHLSKTFNLAPGLDRHDWKLKGSRPANYPMGRLAGLSCFLAGNLEGDLETLFGRVFHQFPLHGTSKERNAWLEKLSGLFSSTRYEYWTFRHTVGGKRLSRPRALVSPDRVALFLINFGVPYFLVKATQTLETEKEERLRKIAHALPRPGSNFILKRMLQLLFGGRRPKGMDAVTDLGLMQIYSDFCLPDPGGCANCVFAGYLERLKDA